MDYTLKKSLGQHFLVDESVSKRIVEALLEQKPSQLVEVGPGGGALTKYLVGLEGIELRCVELDDEKVLWLDLDIDPPFEGKFTVIGNFPYNISTQIVFKVIDWKEQVEVMIGMFQKEVAERIAAKHGTKVYGVTSVLTQAFFRVDYLFEVGEKAFNPPPKVKSAVIKMVPRENVLEMKSQRALFNLVKTAFQQRRKTLRNALKPLFSAEDMKDEIFNKRAEQLSVEDFAALTFKMK
jgi:16S rRNA (adenine1518-N6/adenine1519-N6)-dimethyltransferase